jgi:hypothetical protein
MPRLSEQARRFQQQHADNDKVDRQDLELGVEDGEPANGPNEEGPARRPPSSRAPITHGEGLDDHLTAMPRRGAAVGTTSAPPTVPSSVPA